MPEEAVLEVAWVTEGGEGGGEAGEEDPEEEASEDED